MHSHPIFSHLRNLKPTLVAAVLLVAFLGVCAVGIASSTAQSPQKEERELDDKIPKHLPLKVKVKNMEKVKDLNNDQWMRDVEIEVQNTGNKPIYYLRLSLYFADIKLESGDELGFSIGYGNPQLVDFDKRATPQDMSLRPGETYIYQFSKRWAGRWEKFKITRKLPHPKKIGLQFEVLSYGDGTGFLGTAGVEVTNLQSSNSKCDPQRKAGSVLRYSPEALTPRPRDTQFQFVSFLPANFLPVNFSVADPAEPSPGTSFTQSGICCPGTSCFYLKLTLGGNCFCADELDDPPLEAPSAACGTLAGTCGTQGVRQFICSDNEHTCTSYFIKSCMAPPPTPTPTPECDERTRPNDTNCYCETNFPPFPFWNCLCLDGGDPANYQIAGNVNGCPSGTYNNGRDCCFPIAPTPTPTPTPVGGGCTTPGWNGRCPYGTYPDNGRCCPGGSGGCNGVAAGAETAGLSADSPDSPPSLMPGGGLSCNSEWSWDGCQCVPSSPIVMDIAGDGFRLTDAAGGVSFDLNGDGVAERLSWTSTNSDDAWLALDRDANATIDDGRELFGNFTPQPAPPAGAQRNGFRALALYDWTTNGGNGDGVIDAQDPVFSRLRVWQDTNHNGVSEAGELHRLSSVNVVSLRLAYKESKRADEHGNAFRYRAKLNDAKGAKAGRWAWDVFLVAAAR